MLFLSSIINLGLLEYIEIYRKTFKVSSSEKLFYVSSSIDCVEKIGLSLLEKLNFSRTKLLAVLSKMK